MAAALGSVVVELSANIAKFEGAMSKAAAVAESQAKSIDKSLSIVKTSLSVLGAGFLVNATFDKIKEKILGAIESAAGLQQLSERTGVAASALSGLASVAKLSGTSTDDLAGGLQKLSKAMIDAENGGKKTSAAFEAIGISTNEIRNKNPGEVFKLIAEQLSHYQDGAEKLVIAQVLLGKAGANLLPTLKDLAEVGDLQIKVTDKQAAQADQYEKNLIRFNAASQQIYKIIALEAVPALNDFVKVLIKAQTETGGFTDKAKQLAKDGSLRTFFEEAAIDVAVFIDVLSRASAAFSVFQKAKALGSSLAFGEKGETMFRSKYNDLNHPENEAAAQKRSGLLADFKKEFDILVNGTNKYSEELKKTFAQRRKIEASGVSDAAPGARKKIDASGLGNKNAERSGPKDDPAQKLLDGQLKALEDFIASENKLLGHREQQLSFYAGLEFITQREELETKKRLIAENLAVDLAAYDKEAILLQTRIKTADTEVKRQDAKNKLQEVRKRQSEAEIDANNRILQSEEALEAIGIRFNLATAEVARQADKQNSDARFQIDVLGKTTLEVQKLTSARQIQAALDERIFQIRKQDKNADVSQAVAAAAIQQAQASALIEQSYQKQISGAFGASEAIRKYGEDATNVGAQIESALGNAFKGAEDALVTFVTTGKLSFSSLAASITADIARIIIKQQISNALGVAGSSGGAAGLIGSLIGAFTGTDGVASVASALPGDALTNFINLSGKRAAGGPVGGGRYLVGENGPEILNMNGASGNIIPNNQMRGADGSNQPIYVTNHFVVGPNVDRSTQQQIQASAGRGVQRALARNG